MENRPWCCRGAELVFDPKLKEEALYGFGGGEGFIGTSVPGDLKSMNEDLHLFDAYFFEAWYWNVPDLSAERFKLGGITIGNAFAASETVHGGTQSILFGVSNEKALDYFAIAGDSATLLGPTQMSKPAMVASVGAMEAGSSALMNSTVKFTGFESVVSLIINAWLAATWANETYGP